MDTNKNIGINEFSGGMNADVNYNVILRNLYTYGENVRISTNSLIGEAESPDKKEGSLVLIPEGVEKEISLITGSDRVGHINYARVASIQLMDNLCIVIIKDPIENDDEHYNWSVYRIDLSDEEHILAKNIFTSGNGLPMDRKISTTINKEVNGIIKLYVADGERQILSINVNKEFDEYNQNLDEDQLVSNSYFPKNKITIEKVISGKLPVGQVQYTYRFYKKYGIKSKLAPLTNKILVINNNRNTEKGNAEDTDSSIGFQLKISYNEDCINLFDRILVFRIYYKKVDVDADIELIYDEKLYSDNNDGNIHFMQFNDVGKMPLQEYTAELFSLLDGLDIVPKVIEHNQGYLFAANVNDKTRLKLDGFDARAYSANLTGGVVLYDELDTTYSNNNPFTYDFSLGNNGLNVIESNFTLNKFADVNLSDRDWESNTACRFDAQGFLGGTGPYVSWRFVTTHIPIVSKDDIDKNLAPSIISEDDHQLYYLKLLETGGENDGPTEFHIIEEPIDRTSLLNVPRTNNSIDESEGENPTINSMLRDNGINASAKITYNDILTSSCVRSLRRDEVYRYGIILYDKTGKQSDVNWIADIKTPSANELKMYDWKNNSISYDSQNDTKIDLVLTEGTALSPTVTKTAFRSNDSSSESFGKTSYKLEFGIGTSSEVLISAGQKIYTEQFNPIFDGVSVSTLVTIDDTVHNKSYQIIKCHDGMASSDVSIQLSDLNEGLKTLMENLAIDGDIESDWVDSMKCEIKDWQVSWTSSGLGGQNTEHSVSVDEYNEKYIDYDEPRSISITANLVFTFDIILPGFLLSISIGNIAAYSSESINYVIGTNKSISASYMYAVPIGILFSVHVPENIIGYLIVRCSKDPEYRKNVMLCVSALPIRQQINETKYSPYYPHYLLTTNGYEIRNRGRAQNGNHGIYGEVIKKNVSDPSQSRFSYYRITTDENPSLFLLYSPEITTRRNDSLSMLSDCSEINFFGGVYTNNVPYWIHKSIVTYALISNVWKKLPPHIRIYENGSLKRKYDVRDLYVCKDAMSEYFQMTYGEYAEYDKTNASIVTYYPEYAELPLKTSTIHSIKDTKSPLWENAYSDVLLGGDGEEFVGVTSATKQYKSYTDSITSKEYVNWICNAMYDIKSFKNDVNSDQHYDGWGIIKYGELKDKYGDDLEEWYKIAYDTREVHEDDKIHKIMLRTHNAGLNLPLRIPSNSGFIGPGPSCFIVATNPIELLGVNLITRPLPTNTTVPSGYITMSVDIGTHLVNIRHEAMQYAGLSNSDKQFDIYYGFGNFHLIDETTKTGSSFVFDGDAYIIPFEIVLMFKTYDFNSSDSLQSAQFVYYVALESPINTFFNYGMNFRNTQAKTLLLEPGEISGVASLDRPLNQYNPVLSSNSISNDVYSAKSNEDLTSEFGCRIWFSNHKTSGESMDNWLSFSPLDYLDADSRFGDITCLTSVKDSIYCWQDRSFGKISVNERSLVKDNNSNMIQLGQGGVAQRIDYIDSVHGMSPDLYVCENVANLIYWIDDKNKSIMMSDGTQSVNLSERSNVQSILNREFDNSDLSIGFDLQSDELLCKCLSNGKLIIFNTKLNIATSVYTREYDQLVRIDDKLYGFINNEDGMLALKKYGGLTHLEVGNMKYMPARVEFIMNENSSITKVFDNQEIVFSNITMSPSDFKSHILIGFDTNIANSTIFPQSIDATSFEGNIRYAIPRIGSVDYGNRIRGKWLKVSVELDGYVPNSISHVLTKFRQSY